MSTKLNEFLRRFDRNEIGALSAEYVAVLIVIGLIVAALVAANIPDKVEKCGASATDAVFNVEDSEGNPCSE